MDAGAVDLGILLLRAGTGVTVAAHGYGKFFTGGRIAGTARWFESMGMRPGRVHAVVAASTEVGAGLALAVGLLTPVAGAAVVALMVVAAWTVHRRKGFFIVKSGWEYNLVLALIAVSVATAGPGRWSLDHALAIADTLDATIGLALAAGGGLAAGTAYLALFYRPPPPDPMTAEGPDTTSPS